MERSISQNNWQVVGGFIASAAQEVAMDLGGEELATSISGTIVLESGIPNADVFVMLESTYPGSTATIMTRAEEIQLQTNHSEQVNLKRQIRRDQRKAILRGITSFNLFGTPPRKL